MIIMRTYKTEDSRIKIVLNKNKINVRTYKI